MARNIPVRAMYRSADEAHAAPPGAEPVIADYADPASLERALDGIDAAFVVCGPVPDLIRLETNMITACAAASVRHVVLNSALGAGRYGKSFPSWHIQVEKTLEASGLDWTVIRPNGFMQNLIAYNAPTIRTQRAFYAAMGNARVSVIDVRDVGDAVAGIAQDLPRHTGMTYELNGPEALSNPEIAVRISHAIGEDVAFIDIPEAQQRQAMLDQGMPEWQVTAVLELQEYYRSGQCATVDAVTTTLSGEPPRTLEAFLAENADAFRAAAPM